MRVSDTAARTRMFLYVPHRCNRALMLMAAQPPSMTGQLAFGKGEKIALVLCIHDPVAFVVIYLLGDSRLPIGHGVDGAAIQVALAA